MVRYCIILIALLSSYSQAQAQLDPLAIDDFQIDETRSNSWVDVLFESQITIHLGDTSLAAWSKLDFLSTIEVRAITNHIQTHGPLFSKFEFMAVRGLSQSSKSKLMERMDKVHLVSLVAANEPHRSSSVCHTISLQGPSFFGYSPSDDKKFLGSAIQHYTRLELLTKSWTCKSILEKDRGERWWMDKKGPAAIKTGFEFQIKNKPFSIVLGSFQPMFGRELVHGTGQIMPMGSNSRIVNEIRIDASRIENNGLFGIALSHHLPKGTLHSFLSSRTYATNVDSTSSYFTSYNGSGLHRNEVELRKKGSLRRSEFGLVFHSGVVGLTYRFKHHSIAYKPRHTLWNYPWQNSNRTLHLASVIIQKSIGLLYLNSETAVNSNKGIAHHTTVYGQPDPRLKANASVRFQNTSWEQSSKSIEFQYHLLYAPTFRTELNFTQTFRYGLLPAYQSRYFKPRTRTTLGLVYRKRKQFSTLAMLNRVKQLDLSKTSVRLQVQHVGTASLRIIHRFERNWQRDAPTQSWGRGELLYHDVRWEKNSRLQFNSRLSFFKIDGSGNAISAYENNVLYAYSLTSQNHSGKRFSALVKWRIIKPLTLRIKTGITSYDELVESGSGPDSWKGKARWDVFVQAQYKFK